MAKNVEIRPLERADDRSDFSSGQPDLDRFFEHYAGQNQFKLHLAVTYVAVIEARIAHLPNPYVRALQAFVSCVHELAHRLRRRSR